MKKITLIGTAFLLMLCINVQAQDVVTKTVQTASQGLCDCVNKTYGFMDNDVKDVLVKMVKLKSEEEQANYIATLNEDVLTRLATQASSMESDETEQAFNRCVDDIKYQIDDVASDNADVNITEEGFMALLIDDIKNRNGCDFAAFLLEVGLSEEIENNKDNKGQIKGDSGKSDTKNQPKPKIDDNGGDQRYGSGGN